MQAVCEGEAKAREEGYDEGKVVERGLEREVEQMGRCTVIR